MNKAYGENKNEVRIIVVLYYNIDVNDSSMDYRNKMTLVVRLLTLRRCPILAAILLIFKIVPRDDKKGGSAM